MNCPFCNEPMRKGYLQGAKPFFWSQDKKSLLFICGNDDVQISKGFWNGCFVDSFYCPKCRKLVVEPEEN